MIYIPDFNFTFRYLHTHKSRYVKLKRFADKTNFLIGFQQISTFIKLNITSEFNTYN